MLPRYETHAPLSHTLSKALSVSRVYSILRSMSAKSPSHLWRCTCVRYTRRHRTLLLGYVNTLVPHSSAPHMHARLLRPTHASRATHHPQARFWVRITRLSQDASDLLSSVQRPKWNLDPTLGDTVPKGVNVGYWTSEKYKEGLIGAVVLKGWGFVHVRLNEGFQGNVTMYNNMAQYDNGDLPVLALPPRESDSKAIIAVSAHG